MTTISVSSLSKYYHVFKRSSGVLPAIKSLFSRPKTVVKAVDDISFSIDQGELVGFIGPNGAGKTTTLKCLAGLLFPSTGDISVLGFTPFQRKVEFLKKISLVMGQKNQLWWDLPAMDTFMLNKEIYELSESVFEANLAELTKLLEIEELVKIPTRQLSLGQRMKMELVASLIHKPKVLFLDEPTIGLDVVMQKKMREFIAEYNRIYRATILLTSHYMGDVKHLCKRVIIIDKGKIIYDGLLSELVKKYADTKLISVVFNKNVVKEKIDRIGYLKSYDSSKATFHVPNKEVKKVVMQIFTTYKIEDLTVEEPDIEEVIRLVFTAGKHA